MQLFHTYHHTRLHRVMDKEFWLFELSVWIHVFAYSLVAIFIPILLLQMDFLIGEVILYYFLYHLFDVPLNFLSEWLTRKFGARFVIILGILSSLGFFLVLFHLTPHDLVQLIWLALFAAFYDVFYWIAHIYYFMQNSKSRGSSSKDTSILFMVRRVGSMLAPAFGAVILIFFHEKMLIFLSMILLGISFIPLLKIKKTTEKPTQAALPFQKFFRDPIDRKHYLIQGFYGLHGAAENIMWPLFIYLIFDSIQSVAIVPIIVSVTALVFAYLAGKIKKHDRDEVIIVGSLLIALVWILRLFFEHPLFYYVSIFLVGLFSIFVMLPMNAGMYERGQQRDPLSAALYQNLASMLFKAVLFGALVILVNVFDVSFITASISMFMIIFVTMF